tara:strand:- start:17814 stop:19682 length:1869 start_codon:yes stop_codon:yes gene_type:complete
MRLGDMDRLLHNKKASRVTTGVGEPSKREGSDGDITIRNLKGKGIFLFVKYNNKWYARTLFDGPAEIGMSNPGRTMQLFGWNPDAKAYSLIDASEVFELNYGSPGKLTLGSKKAKSGATATSGTLTVGDSTNAGHLVLGKGSGNLPSISAGSDIGTPSTNGLQIYAGVSNSSTYYTQLKIRTTTGFTTHELSHIRKSEDTDEGALYQMLGSANGTNPTITDDKPGIFVEKASSGTDHILKFKNSTGTHSLSHCLPLAGGVMTGAITMTDTTAPSTPSSGFGVFYVNSDKPYFKSDDGTAYDLTGGGGGGITVQSGNPAAISEFDSVDFIYGTSSNRLYHKVDSNTMAYEQMTEVSLIFSISDSTFRTASSGGSETANAILVGTATNMYLDVNYNNCDGTLDSNPVISYKRNGSQTDVGTGHLGTSVTSNTHTSSTAFVVPQTDNASDSSSDGAFSRHCASGDYISVTVTSVDDTVSDSDTSERYYFVNGMVWGSCAATTGPTAAEFLESFSAGLNATGGKGYALPTLSGGSFSNSQYHSDFGSRQITADSGSEYIFFAYPDQGGTASTIRDSSGTDISGDFRTVQTFGSTSTYPNASSNGYMEVYNVYVSDNTGVSLEVTVT